MLTYHTWSIYQNFTQSKRCSPQEEHIKVPTVWNEMLWWVSCNCFHLQLRIRLDKLYNGRNSETANENDFLSSVLRDHGSTKQALLCRFRQTHYIPKTVWWPASHRQPNLRSHVRHPIEAETKWQPFSRRYFQICFLNLKCINSDSDFTEVFCKGSN